jgi:hypothetical protein
MDEQQNLSDEQRIEKLLEEEAVARQKVQDALRHSPLTQPKEVIPAQEPLPVQEATTEERQEKAVEKDTEKEKVKKSEHKKEDNDKQATGIPGVMFHKTSDENTLVDVHVNNPLKRVIALLEEIKKQKAFSFTLRGSLGIMGVVLTLSVFGVFGGGKILCDKGLQTRTGTIRVLQVTEEHTDPTIPWSKAMLLKLFHVSTPITRQRVVLISDNEPPIHLVMTLKEKPEKLNGQQVIATGNLNGCSSTLSIPNEQSLEEYRI